MGGNLRRVVTALIVGLCMVGGLVSIEPAAASRGAVVIDAESGAVLYQKRAGGRHYPASLTKLMTLYLLFEALESGRVKLATRLPVSARAAGQPKSKLGVRKGGTITVRNAILALVTKSANDVATVVAEALGGEEWQFARTMTRKARALGMRRTSFRNASGLPNRRQLTSARDIAILARALYRDFPQYYHFFGSQNFSYRGKKYRNSNRLLWSYAGVDGLKTGYIRASRFNLAASATRGGRRVIAVVLGAGSPKARDREVAALLTRGFSQLREVPAAPPPPPPEKPITVANAPWAIQVGAYRRVRFAYAALRKSLVHIPGIVGRSSAMIVPVEEGDGGLWRARFVGVNPSAARRGCRILIRKKFDCEVVRHLPDSDALPLAN